MTRTPLWAWGVLAIMAANGACADSEPPRSPDELFDLSLEELSQIKVSVASRNEQLLRDTASLVTVFTDNDLQRLGVRTLAELLTYVPGMRSYRNSSTSPWFDSLEVRGVRDDFDGMLLLLIDGRRINSPYNGGIAQIFRYALQDAARVEIIRGPGSALYGSSALLGVINLISRNNSNSASASVGSDGGRALAISAAFQHGDWRGSAHAGHERSDGQHYRIDNDTTGRIREIDDPYRDSTVRLQLGYQNFEWFGWAYDQALDGFYQVNFVHPDNRTDQDGYQTGLRGNWQDNEAGWQISSQISRQVLRQRSYANRASGGAPPFLEGDWLGGFLIEANSDVLSVDGTWQPGATDQLSAGARLSEEKIRRAELYSNYDLRTFEYLGSIQATNDLIPPTSREVTGVYAQHQRQWTPHWQTTLGLRYDHYEETGSDSSPRMAISYHDGDDDTFKLMWGEAYRAPMFNELYTSGNPVSLGNEELNAVRSETLELAWLHESDDWRLEASLFDQTIRDQILSEFIGPGLRQFTNSGRLAVQGAEFDWLWSWSPRWRTRLYASWIASIDEDIGNSTGQDSNEHNTPRHWGGVELNFVTEQWSWHLATDYTGSIAALPEQGAYWRTRSHLQWRWRSDLTASLTINNLFDEQYETLSNLAGFGFDDDGNIERRLPGRGRELWLQLDWRW